jgi:hypothetical protein
MPPGWWGASSRDETLAVPENGRMFIQCSQATVGQSGRAICPRRCEPHDFAGNQSLEGSFCLFSLEGSQNQPLGLEKSLHRPRHVLKWTLNYIVTTLTEMEPRGHHFTNVRTFVSFCDEGWPSGWLRRVFAGRQRGAPKSRVSPSSPLPGHARVVGLSCLQHAGPAAC